MITRSDITNTYRYIKDDIYKTPLVLSRKLSELSGANVYLKMEQLQHSGSFKIRGVLSKFHTIKKADFNKPFVAASTGNHGAAFCHAADKLNVKGVLFLPEDTSPAKVQALEGSDVEIIFHGANCMDAESKAGTYAKEVNGILIHPYNDLEIIKGQGTIGLEIAEQLPEVNTILAPIGGGGLIGGIASYFKDLPDIDVVGCQPTNAAEMYHSIKAGHIVPPSTLHTISDATAGGIEEKSITFDICNKLLDGIELIDEEDIKKALAFIVKYHQTLIEPACAMPVAALLNSKRYAGTNIVLVLTGKKVNITLLKEILNAYSDCY
ncbi:MAG: pyridoxal-phosphate dependent enzyme [Calditrichia bacterium]